MEGSVLLKVSRVTISIRVFIKGNFRIKFLFSLFYFFLNLDTILTTVATPAIIPAPIAIPFTVSL